MPLESKWDVIGITILMIIGTLVVIELSRGSLIVGAIFLIVAYLAWHYYRKAKHAENVKTLAPPDRIERV